LTFPGEARDYEPLGAAIFVTKWFVVSFGEIRNILVFLQGERLAQFITEMSVGI